MKPVDPMKPLERDRQNRLLCTAHRKNGQPCRAPAIAGGRVCHKHGGAAPQTKAAAQLRMACLISPAIGVIEKALTDYKRNPETALRAATALLDRTGHGPTAKFEHSSVDGTTDIQEIGNVILEALKEYPEARIAVARRLFEVGQAMDTPREKLQ